MWNFGFGILWKGTEVQKDASDAFHSGLDGGSFVQCPLEEDTADIL